MKLITDAAWFRALRGLRRRSPVAPDAADMGTAFGLDSITIVCDDDTDSAAPGLKGEASGGQSVPNWLRRLERRSRL